MNNIRTCVQDPVVCSAARAYSRLARPSRGQQLDDQPDVRDLRHAGAALLHLLVPQQPSRRLRLAQVCSKTIALFYTPRG